MGAPSSTLQVAVTDQIALVKISGRASFNCSVDFKTLVYELRDRGYRNFVLDLNGSSHGGADSYQIDLSHPLHIDQIVGSCGNVSTHCNFNLELLGNSTGN